jgi:hypothetical protein
MNRQPVLPHKLTPTTGEHSVRAARLVLALPDSPRAGEIRTHFAEQGWEVHDSRGGCATRRLARKLCPAAVVLAVDNAHAESGWLTCNKLLFEKPHLRVVLLGEKPSPRAERLAEFVGAAAYLPVTAPLAQVEKAVAGTLVVSRN